MHKIITDIVYNIEKVLIEYGAINPKFSEDYNSQYNTRHKKTPSFFTPFESNQEAAIVALNTIAQPMAAIVASLHKPYDLAPSKTDSMAEAFFVSAALYIAITPVLLSTVPFVTVGCALNFMTRLIGTIVNEFNKLLSSNSQAESSFSAGR